MGRGKEFAATNGTPAAFCSAAPSTLPTRLVDKVVSSKASTLGASFSRALQDRADPVSGWALLMSLWELHSSDHIKYRTPW